MFEILFVDVVFEPFARTKLLDRKKYIPQSILDFSGVS